MPKNISKLHYEILNNERQKIWHWLKEFKTQGVLGGGTALALQLNHRLSYDFDIFLKEPITKRLLNKLRKIFGQNNIHPLIDNDDELTVLYKNHIKLTFIYFPFNNLFPLTKTNSLSLFNPKDLAAYKAYAIGRRGIYRDYIDVYFLLKNKLTLKQIVADSRKIFKNNFNEKLFLQQLAYFGDLKDFQIEFINSDDKKITPKKVEDFFVQEIKKYLSK